MLQDFADLQLEEIKKNIMSRRNRIFLLMEEVREPRPLCSLLACFALALQWLLFACLPSCLVGRYGPSMPCPGRRQYMLELGQVGAAPRRPLGQPPPLALTFAPAALPACRACLPLCFPANVPTVPGLQVRRLRIQLRLRGGSESLVESLADEAYPSSIPFFPPITDKTIKLYLNFYALAVASIIVFGACGRGLSCSCGELGGCYACR